MNPARTGRLSVPISQFAMFDTSTLDTHGFPIAGKRSATQVSATELSTARKDEDRHVKGSSTIAPNFEVWGGRAASER